MSRPQIPAADQTARKERFIALYKRMNHKNTIEVADLCGIRPQTVRMYLSHAISKYPSESVLVRLEAAYLHDLEAHEAAAAAAAKKAHRARIAFEQELAA